MDQALPGRPSAFRSGGSKVIRRLLREKPGDDTLDDATVEEGDEHRIQISGAPLASMMCIENPESFREILCVAPAEGQRPLNFMTDPKFEAMSNPDKFPYGGGTFSTERPRKLTYIQSKTVRC